eukprot:tig00001057_g6697.t1
MQFGFAPPLTAASQTAAQLGTTLMRPTFSIQPPAADVLGVVAEYGLQAAGLTGPGLAPSPTSTPAPWPGPSAPRPPPPSGPPSPPSAPPRTPSCPPAPRRPRLPRREPRPQPSRPAPAPAGAGAAAGGTPASPPSEQNIADILGLIQTLTAPAAAAGSAPPAPGTQRTKDKVLRGLAALLGLGE